MANPMAARMVWSRLRQKTRGKLTGAMQGRAMFWLTKQWKREIGVVASELMGEVSGFGTQQDIRSVFGRRLREHFEALRKRGVGYRDLGEEMIRDLSEMMELVGETNPDRRMLLESLKARPLEAVLEEMREHARQMRAMEARQAAA